MQLLGSKNKDEVERAIQGFRSFKQLNIEKAEQGIKKMILLMIADASEGSGKGIDNQKNGVEEKIPEIQQKVIDTYVSIYLGKDKAEKEAKNLVYMMMNADPSEEVCYELFM